jgi:protein O-GlcNAc transferase
MTVRELIAAGHAHYRAGRFADAAEAYRQALALAPDDPDALHYTGVMAFQRGQLGAALDLVQRSVALAPRKATYHANLGLVLYAAHRFDEAVAAQQQAIALQRDAPRLDAFNSLGTSLFALERTNEAIDAYRNELALHPGNAPAWSNLGAALSETGRIDEAIDCYRRAIELDPADSLTHGNLLMLLHFDPASDAGRIRDAHRAWARRHAEPLAPEVRPHRNDRTPGRKLKVGYVSPDLRGHVVGWSLLPILACHDRGQFEIFCYSDCARPDDVTEKLRGHADAWRDTARLNDAGLAEQVRDDRIDVLVDLTLHMSNNRMLAFARKPAPVQVTYLGYAASTGLPAMDFRITDAHMDPPGAPPDGPEELLRLPDCYWAYRPPDAAAALPVEPPPALRNGFVTFGSFNNYRKVNPAAVATWAAALRQVPDAQLLVVLNGGAGNTHVPLMFQQHGVDPTRVRLLPRQNLDRYFRLHAEVDIALDPFPYNGGVTTLNATWMGVPTVTLAGERAAGRAGLSLLTNLGLDDLVATTRDEYVTTLVRLAGDVGRLASLRMSLRERLRASPLMDERRFTRALEWLYAQAWERWRNP